METAAGEIRKAHSGPDKIVRSLESAVASYRKIPKSPDMRDDTTAEKDFDDVFRHGNTDTVLLLKIALDAASGGAGMFTFDFK